jgi:hypothetical protein
LRDLLSSDSHLAYIKYIHMEVMGSVPGTHSKMFLRLDF